ncbi:MAG TPA: caspase family protein [Chloroflexia bacterium]|nr:caspase family protein [Chloroflexia bacterium]
MNKDALPDSGPSGTAAKRALLIGIDAYQAVNPLQGCVNDILSVHDFLLDKAQIPPNAIQLLLAPDASVTLPGTLGPVLLPTKAQMQQSLAQLAAQTGANDEVVIYYAGHGTRIPNPQDANQHIGAIVPVDARLDGTNFVLNVELNQAIDAVVAKGAQVTLVLDSCHSGGAERDLATTADPPAVREIQLDATQINWPAFQAEHPQPPPATAAPAAGALAGAPTGSKEVETDGSGWLPDLQQGQELIVLSGCRDTELSHEYTPPGTAERHGALTYFLIDTLRNTPAEQVAQTRWQDIYPRIRQNVLMAFSSQTPTLEGRGERPVFGGAWQPYAPGFTVITSPGSPALTLNGGDLHGLSPGAEIAIYPPATADFAQAAAAGVPAVKAVIDSATAVTSQAHVTDPPGAPVANGARALLTKPGTNVPPLPVLLTNVPEALAAGIRAAAGADAFLQLNPAGPAPAVEVRPWPVNGQDGWALVKYSGTTAPVSADDVIATAGGGDPASVGQQIGLGLVHWARYRAILNRHNDDPALQGALRLEVRAAPDSATLRSTWTSPTAPVRAPNAAGRVVVGESEVLLLKVSVNTDPLKPAGLSLVLLLCSDDGNIDQFWPPANADNVVPQGEDRPVGLNGPNPFRLSVRADQTASLYTFKLLGASQPIPTDSLLLPETVQAVVDGGSRGVALAAAAADVLWTTLEVPVLVVKNP